MKSLKIFGLSLLMLSAIFALNTFGQTAERFVYKDRQVIGKQPADQPVRVKPTAKDGVLLADRDGVLIADRDGVLIADFIPEVANTINYSFLGANNGTLTNMATGTTTLVAANLDDTASALTSIGFDFYFQGVRYTQFGVNDNGNIRLGAASQTSTPYQPLAQAGIPIITAYGADQRTHLTGKVHFKVIGAAPNRTLVIEWLNSQANFNAGGTADLTYQVRLNETTGIIEFVYGVMTMSVAGAASADSNDPQIGFSSNSTAGNVGSVTAPQTGAPPPSYNGASATPTNNLYVAGAITTLSNAVDGSRTIFTFTPPVPPSPAGAGISPITATSLTLNWADVAGETQYAIFRSTDNVTFTFIGSAAENATSFLDSGLTPSTTYFYHVNAVSEGALSTDLAMSAATAPAGSDSCLAAGGNWSAPGTWADGTVPTAGDNVTIQAGCTVTIDVTTAVAINVTVQSGGTLQYITTPASTLTVNADLTIDAGGTFTAGSGVLLTHILNIGGSTTASSAAGNLTVNGTFDMNTTAGVTTNFFGTTNGTLSGAGATADFFALVGQKGTNQTAVLDVTRVITISSPAASGSRLTVNGGTVKISSATVGTPWFGSNTITGANGRLWLNNAGASLQCVGTGTSATGAGSPTFTGQLRVDSGLFGYGQGNNTLTFTATTGSLVMNGGTINMFGNLLFSANSSMTMTAGDINVDPQNVTASAATNNIVRFTGPNVVAFTGGTVTIVDPHAATGTGRALSFSTSSAATYNLQGGTFRFGDGVSTTAGSVDGFDIDPFVGTALVALGNVTVNNTATNAATRFVRISNALAPFQAFILGDLNVNSAGGSRFNLNGHLVAFGKDIINDGIIDGTTASSRLYWIGNGVASNYSGSGTQIAPLQSWDVDNALGVSINSGITNVVTRRIILFTGGVNAGADKLTLGNGDATVNVVQIGNTTTPTAAGGLNTLPTFNLGAGGQSNSYLNTVSSYVMGNEINPARTLVSLTYNDTTAGHTLTQTGGNLLVTGALALTNGVVLTNNQVLTHNGAATRTTGYVDGILNRSYTATGAYTYFVGQGGFSPVLATITALTTNPSDLSVQPFDATLAGFSPTQSISRNWLLTENGNLTADISLTYLVADENGNEADYRVYRRNGAGVATDLCGAPCVNTGTNVAGPALGVVDFGRFTAAEAITPTGVTANLSGRIWAAGGMMPIANVRVILSGGPLTESRTVYTGHFGYYNFEDLPVGHDYVVTVKARRFSFTSPSRIINLQNSVSDADFTALPQW